MDLTPRGLLNSWFPQFPKLIKTAFLAALGWSENSEYQDFITQVIIQAARPVLQTPAPLLASQKFFTRDFGIWGRMWVSKYTVPAPKIHVVTPETPDNVLTVEEAIKFAIDVLATRPEEKNCHVNDSKDVEIEWTAYRKNVWHTERPPRVSEREIYGHMMEDLNAEICPTVLYCHGGAFCLMDPSNHRWTTSLLGQYANARIMSIRYRLSPQAIFPDALTDVFISYLSLLSPHSDAFHTATDPRNIIIAGDSSGAGLATALQLLLHTLIMHKKTKISWHDGSIVTIADTPSAALSLTSAYLDVTRSLPSCIENARWDIIAPPPPLIKSTLSTSPLFPADEIWPSKPPRTETYCTAKMCAHPLVSPLLAQKELLRHLPPLYVCTGWESMTDEAEVFCRRVWEAKTTSKNLDIKNNSPRDSTDGISDSIVIVNETEDQHLLGANQASDLSSYDSGTGAYIDFDGYIGMPHTFSFIPFNKAGWTEVDRRTRHFVESVALAHGQPSALKKTNFAKWTHSKTLQTELIEMRQLGISSQFSGYNRTEPLTEDLIHERVNAGWAFRVHLEDRLQAEWKAQQSATQE